MKLQTTHYRIGAEVPQGVTFAFVSDLHEADNRPIMDAISSGQPDAVLVGGDFIHSDVQSRLGLEFLHLCAGKYPTFCSLGNHEQSCIGSIRKSVLDSGVTLLDNCATVFRGINIGGLSSGFRYMETQDSRARTPMPDVAWLGGFCNSPGYKLLLCHHPEYYEPHLRHLPIDLIVSGHAHGGQWRFFGRGLFSPGQGIFPKYTSGMYDGRLIVSRGIGNMCSVPRINNRPEVVIIRLLPASARSDPAARRKRA